MTKVPKTRKLFLEKLLIFDRLIINEKGWVNF
jgi:hypothetical protein